MAAGLKSMTPTKLSTLGLGGVLNTQHYTKGQGQVTNRGDSSSFSWTLDRSEYQQASSSHTLVIHRPQTASTDARALFFVEVMTKQHLQY